MATRGKGGTLEPSDGSPNNHKRPRKSFCFGITNLEWVALKVMYFCQYGTMGSILPYIILFYRGRGLSAGQIGLIELAFTFTGSFSRPLFGSIADRTGRHRLVLGFSILSYTIFFFALIFVRPSVPSHIRYPLTLRCNTSNHEFELEACRSAESILTNVSQIQPELVLHHSELGFQNNCSSVGYSCQLVCRDFVPIKSQPGKASTVEPFIGLGLHVGGNRSSSMFSQCSAYPLAVTTSYKHVSLVCNNTQSMPCDIDCTCSSNKTDIDPLSYNRAAEERLSADNKRMFFTILMLRCIGAIPFGPSISLTDSITYDVLGPKHRGLWGQQRMFGTISWGIVAGILGEIIDVLDSFECVFYCLGIFGVSATLVALFWLPKRMPNHGHHHLNGGSTKDSKLRRPAAMPFCMALRSVFRIPLFCISCAVAVASGMFLGVLYVPWPMYMTQELGAPKLFIGISYSLSCGLEVPSLFFAGAIVARLGEVPCFLLMFAAYAIRCLAYAFLTPSLVWLALILELLHMFCFAFYFTAATRFVASVAPPGTSATVQAILHASYFGIGMGLGNLASSFIYQLYGGKIAFLIYSAFAAFLFVILLILYFAYLRKEISHHKSKQPERIGSFSPTLNPDASYVDEEEEQGIAAAAKNNSNNKTVGGSSEKKPLPEPAEPLITSSPHLSSDGL